MHRPLLLLLTACAADPCPEGDCPTDADDTDVEPLVRDPVDPPAPRSGDPFLPESVEVRATFAWDPEAGELRGWTDSTGAARGPSLLVRLVGEGALCEVGLTTGLRQRAEVGAPALLRFVVDHDPALPWDACSGRIEPDLATGLADLLATMDWEIELYEAIPQDARRWFSDNQVLTPGQLDTRLGGAIRGTFAERFAPGEPYVYLSGEAFGLSETFRVPSGAAPLPLPAVVYAGVPVRGVYTLTATGAWSWMEPLLWP